VAEDSLFERCGNAAQRQMIAVSRKRSTEPGLQVRSGKQRFTLLAFFAKRESPTVFEYNKAKCRSFYRVLLCYQLLAFVVHHINKD